MEIKKPSTNSTSTLLTYREKQPLIFDHSHSDLQDYETKLIKLKELSLLLQHVMSEQEQLQSRQQKLVVQLRQKQSMVKTALYGKQNVSQLSECEYGEYRKVGIDAYFLGSSNQLKNTKKGYFYSSIQSPREKSPIQGVQGRKTVRNSCRHSNSYVPSVVQSTSKKGFIRKQSQKTFLNTASIFNGTRLGALNHRKSPSSCIKSIDQLWDQCEARPNRLAFKPYD